MAKNKSNKNPDLNVAINGTWESLKRAVEHYKKMDKQLVFDENKQQIFYDHFQTSYTSVMNAHMDSTVSELDRHKVAAVIIEATLSTGVIQREGSNYGRVFMGQEMIAAEVAFEWMMLRFKKKLEELDLNFDETTYHMPIAFACDTPYFDVFCRNLYFSKEAKKLNVLDIANTLFLLEYVTLLKYDIDPQLLHGK